MSGTLRRFGSIAAVGMKAIARNKMRSALTMLGIVIGVASVITMVAVGTGSSRAIQSTISALGTNFIMIMPGAVTQSGARLFGGQSRLTVEDALGIRGECPSIAYTSPGVRTIAQVVAAELNWSTTVYGVDVDWPLIRTWNVERGSFFTEPEVRAGSKVCVLGATVVESLFPDNSPLGRVVRIKNVPFRVIGVLERKGGNMMGQDQDDQIVAPYTTVMNRLLGSERIQLIYASAVSEAAIGPALEEIDAYLRQRHRIRPGQEADFMLRSQEEIAATSAETSRTLSTLLGSVAAISLLVGGIGIMNIMLVSVTERTREIGIRMAIGAKGKHVMAQFLLEAVTLSLFGGALGAGLGVGASKLISRFAGWPTEIGGGSVLLAFLFSAAVGVFFGWYPARKASRLDPIEALRFE